MPGWSNPSDPNDPDALTPEDSSWVEAFQGIGDLSESLAAADKHGGAGVTLSVTELRLVADRILNLTALVEQGASIRTDATAAMVAQAEAEALERITRSAGAGVRMAAAQARTHESGAAEKIAARKATKQPTGDRL